MRLSLIALLLCAIGSFGQNLQIVTPEKKNITAQLIDSAERSNILIEFKGKQDDFIRKKLTARTYKLSDGRILIEFFDKNAAIVANRDQFEKLERVRFVKNTIDFLKKNISYKIDLTYDEGKKIIEKEKPKRLTQYKSDLPQSYNFEVYRLSSGQILFLHNSGKQKTATLFPDIKTLASEDEAIQEATYSSEDDEHLMKALASGNRLPDYDVESHLFYPKYQKELIKNHKLTLVKEKVYVSTFYGDLYKSEKGYFILLDNINQKNGEGDKMQILSLRIYDRLEDLKEAVENYSKFKDKPLHAEHYYQKISNQYGQKFANYVPQLIDTLPALLNFDREQLSFESTGMDLVDEALQWASPTNANFNKWFPSVLAYYGQCFMNQHKDGTWITTYDKEYNIWIPEMKLKDGTFAWDPIDFYSDLYEGPTPIRWAGDWNGDRKRLKLLFKNRR